MSGDGPFKLDENGQIVGPVPLASLPGMPGLVVFDVRMINRFYQLARQAGRDEERNAERIRRQRIADVIADVELDLEPSPDFEAMRKKPP